MEIFNIPGTYLVRIPQMVWKKKNLTDLNIKVKLESGDSEAAANKSKSNAR
jgi:hypothetical protein